MTRSPWTVIIVLSLAALGVLFFGAAPAAQSGKVDLSSHGPPEPTNAIRGEVVEGPGGTGELVIFATSLEPELDELEVTVPGRDEPVRIARRDLEIGARITLPTTAAESLRDVVANVEASDAEASASAGPWASRFDGNILRLDRPIGTLRPRQPVPVEPESPPSRQTIRWSIEVERHRLAEGGGFEVPIYAVAQTLRPDGSVGYTQAAADTVLRVRVDGVFLGELTVQRQATRSTDKLFVALRRDESVAIDVVAPDGTPTRLALDWATHGPKGLELIVLPDEGEAFATPISSIAFAIHARDEHGLLRPADALTILVDPPQGVRFEPATPRLEGDDPGQVTVRADRATQGHLVLSIPDLDISKRVPIHFRTPWAFLGIAALLAVVGVAAARRSQLLDQGKLALAFEIFAAAAGGSLLYTAFLSQWLPAPGALLGELPAGAIGILGGYLGDGVFQLLAKRIGIGD